MSATVLKRSVLAAIVVVCVSLFVTVAQAGAAVPWWQVTTFSAPAASVGGESDVMVEAVNLGDAYVNGIEHPVTLVDKLPAGMTVSAVHPEGGGGTIGLKLVSLFLSCTVAESTLTCTYSGPLLAYESLEIGLTVKFAAGAGDGMNEVMVSGGGAATVVSRRPLALENPKPSYGVENYEVKAEEEGGAADTQAGSHPFQLTTTLVLNTQTSLQLLSKGAEESILPVIEPVALTKDLRFSLPPGLIGNPTPLPKCSTRTFTESFLGGAHEYCPADTVVGVATPIVTLNRAAPFGDTTPLYSLVPSVGEPAKFGFQTVAGPVILDTSLRPGGGYGVVVTVSDITEEVLFMANRVTFWGSPADPRHDTSRGSECLGQFGKKEHAETEEFKWELACPVQAQQPLLITPTLCTGPMHTRVEADPWVQAGQFQSKEYTFQDNEGEPYSQDGCNRLNFEPAIRLTPDGQQGSTPTGLTVDEHIPQEGSLNPVGLADSTVKDTTVALPAGVAINSAGADGLSACGLTQVGSGKRDRTGMPGIVEDRDGRNQDAAAAQPDRRRCLSGATGRQPVRESDRDVYRRLRSRLRGPPEDRRRSQTRPGHRPVGLDIRGNPTPAIRRPEAAFLWWFARTVGHPCVVRWLYDHGVDSSMVWERSGRFLLRIQDHEWS